MDPLLIIFILFITVTISTNIVLVDHLSTYASNNELFKFVDQMPFSAIESLQLDIDSSVTDVILKGKIIVRNLSYEKLVIIRHSMNEWLSFTDLTAGYERSINHVVDEFAFELNINLPDVGYNMCFSIMYSVGGDTFWNNNFNRNFCFEMNSLNVAAIKNEQLKRWNVKKHKKSINCKRKLYLNLKFESIKEVSDDD